MEPSSETFASIFSESVQYKIPVFQRRFEWKEEQWDDYFNTLFRKYYSNDLNYREFLGTVVVKKIVETPNPIYWIIDGQQRLTTTYLALSAIKSVFSDQNDIVNNINRLIFFQFDETKINLPKLELSDYDNPDFSSILTGYSKGSFNNVNKCYDYFLKKYKESYNFFDPKKITDSILNGLQFILIKLDFSDNVGYIFETLNLTGIRLEPIDIIRNTILGKFDDIHTINHLYKTFWKSIEDQFKNMADFPIFLRYFLLKDPDKLKSGIFRQEQLSHAIMDRLSIELKGDQQFDDIQSFLAEMKLYADYYNIIILSNPKRLQGTVDEKLIIVFQKLKYLLGTQYMHFVLKCMNRYKNLKTMKQETLIQILKIIETYYVRKNVCNISFKSTEQVFLDLCSSINNKNEEQIIQIVKENLSFDFPDDYTFEKNFSNNDFYKSNEFNNFTRFILLSIEERKGGIGVNFDPIGKLTLEHIMPQTLTKEWKNHLGRYWKDHDYYLHTIGNLTLLTKQMNSSFYNKNFLCKFDKVADTGLCINNNLAKMNHWKIKDIEERTNEFLKIALEIWPSFKTTSNNSDVSFRPLEKYAKIYSLTIKGKNHEVKTMPDLIELTIKGIIFDKKWSNEYFVKKDKANELSTSEEQFKSYQLIDCDQYGKIYCKKCNSVEIAYKFCTRLLEYADWHPNEDWYGMAKFRNGDNFIDYKFA
ncbi:DUF262 domain-containing protein [Methanospirillum lacunae]|uniref:DUF262 domain-containing protein n=1 Tax=Methanospirillum lacunae TaxID=668570 RepID=A0A2V2MTQ5_9EURY|nr:DUF262 domain-containing protein [Methanospirillum lacunae]PWR71412.1 hypothetical protein DK846_11135 [Methanospirillum lacunae]